MPPAHLQPALARFGLDGGDVGVERVSGGYINETYRVTRKGKPAYILQKINSAVFPAADQVMENLSTLLPFLEGPGYAALELEPTSAGTPWLQTDEGEIWRLFHYIPDSGTLEHTENPGISREAGRILGCFHQLASKAPVEKLHTPLPGFHDLGWRARQLEESVTSGMQERIKEVEAELLLSQGLIAFCQQIPMREFPVRICHNDTKLSNILFDLKTGKALCMIDLDTLMPGCLLYDFGDAARTLLSPVAESAANRGAFRVNLGMYEAFVRGWGESGMTLESAEARWLAHGVVLMPTLHGIRALADHLSGDRYYQTAFPGQNLVRAKNLLGFAAKVREVLPEMEVILRKILG
jgi:Ser/Thr protein kinase RdoA (MazF antagonist)